ncbi:PREDICTED: phospholipase D4 [Ceratotherium simum simum]|uniref:Phospholipase D4 n=1 Tax=Ceratotherium simum simum TaxID=73337 RepID=A0ABM0HUU7_CERSS|nr:PREDICTED: phospholipase D4 [Ceratotherium simum simum]
MKAKAGPPEVLRPLQKASVASAWPCTTPSHSPQDRDASTLQVLAVLALLWLGAATLTYLLWPASSLPTWGQVHPEEGPTRSRGCGSRPPWEARRRRPWEKDSCQLVLVESIPQDLPSAAGSPAAQPLAQAWLQLLDAAQERVHVASYYWSLTGPDIGVNDSSSQLGEALLQKLQQLLDRNISLAVATSSPTLAKNSTDLQVLAARGAQVRHVPMWQLTGGVLHSKFWVVDGRHVYLGSANMDWRSLTQVKELGTIIYNCSRLARDLEKTFQTYWVLGAPKAVLPKSWPRNFSSHINRFRPLREHFDGVPTTAYFSASPPSLCPHGRTRDLDALLAVIGAAREFIYASVMEYFPTTRFRHPARYWPALDTALRAAAFNRGVQVRLLVSCWVNTDPHMFPFLRSLQALNNPQGVSVDVKVFIVPVRNHSNIPFSRVNHSKFMVTEKAAYIGTSNWSEDYFSSTSGVGLVVSQRPLSTQWGVITVQEQLQRLFERDWNSPYAIRLDGHAQGQNCTWQG